MPLLTIMRPRSQAQLLWMGSEFDAVPEHVPDWNRHLRLAREMLDTQAHRLKPHTHPAHSPARPADTRIPLTSPLLCRVQGELWRNPPSQYVILLGVSFDFWQCGELELRIAKPHSAPSTTLRRFRGCFPTTKLRPWPTAQRAAAASSQCCVCRLSGGVAFAGCWGPAQAGPRAAQESGSRPNLPTRMPQGEDLDGYESILSINRPYLGRYQIGTSRRASTGRAWTGDVRVAR